jgi:hypothetical protein
MKKNKFKSKAKQSERHEKEMILAYVKGAKASNMCSIESFKAIAENGDRKSMTIEEVILFLELTQEHLEENFKNAGSWKN